MLNLAGVRAVFFDAAGTLFGVRGTVGEIYCGIASHYGVVSEPEEVQRAFQAALGRMPPMAFPGLSGPDLLKAERGWWREVVGRVFLGKLAEDELEACFSNVYESFRGSETWELLPETRETLAHLKDLGYRLGVISNFDSRLHDVLAALGIQAFLECVIISSISGFAKPDERIFFSALEHLGICASEGLHVGDSLEADVQGALRAGLHAVLMDPTDSHAGQSPVERIRNLSDLCGLLVQE